MTETRQMRRARERRETQREHDRGSMRTHDFYRKYPEERPAAVKCEPVPQYHEPPQSGRTASADPAASDVPKPRLLMPGGAIIALALAASLGGGY